MASFDCYVFPSDNGPAIAGCSLRLLDGSGKDVTPFISGGISPVVTDEAGGYHHTFPEGTPGPLPLGVYTVVASAPGYEPYAGTPATLSASFNGIGLLSIVLNPLGPESSTSIGLDGPAYVSPMYPVEITIDAQAPSASYEMIEAVVETESGGTSSILVPVVDGQAVVNLQARLNLDPDLVFVPDTAVAVIDPGFAETFSVTCNSITTTGKFPIGGKIIVHAANAFPSVEANDLTNYTNENGPADWLTPFAEVPKFLGRYADVMIWLPKDLPGPYTLALDFLNINRVSISTSGIALDKSLFAQKKVVRVRIPEPVAGGYYLKMQIVERGHAQTTPLTIRYIHA